MTPEQIKCLIFARAHTDKISMDNTIEYLRVHPEIGAKLLADYENVSRGLASILEDLNEMIALEKKS